MATQHISLSFSESLNSSHDSSAAQRRRKSNPRHNIFENFPQMKRLLKFKQMDFEMALWQMIWLLISPRKVVRNIQYHKQTKNQWARDDPAFIVLLSLGLIVMAVVYGIREQLSFGGVLKLIFFSVFIDFFLVGFFISTFSWIILNKFMKQKQRMAQMTDQSVEWAYCFDVHSNGFMPLFFFLYFLHFFLYPALSYDNFISRFFSNSLYFFSICYYHYITFLGYSILPFLEKTIYLMFPVGIWAFVYLISLFTFNCTRLFHYLYFE